MANLLLLAKLTDEYYIICNTKIDDTIYVQSKDDSKYLRFQRDYKANLDKHCYLNTVKEGKTTFSILDQKRLEAVRILQERCGFPSDEDFIHALECNSIEGMIFVDEMLT